VPIIAPPYPALTYTPPPIGLYRTPASQEAISRSAHALIDFNGLILNDRRVPDLYRITDIAGLGDADLRNTSVEIPSMDGEIPFDSFYGGRTLTMTGKIESGTFAQAQQMKMDLTAAFAELKEKPLKFRWWDVYDDFSDANTLAFYSTFSGVGSLSQSPAGLNIGSSTIVHMLRTYGDARTSVKVYCNAVPYLAASAGVVAKVSGNKLIQARILASGGNLSLVIERIDPLQGGTVALATASNVLTVNAGMGVWVRLGVAGDSVTADLWTVDPFTAPFGATATAQVLVNLSSADADAFGDSTSGSSGITVGQPSSGAWLVDDFRVESSWPGDVQINCRKAQSMSIANALPAKQSIIKQDFQITLRASNPRFTSSIQQQVVVPPNAAANFGMSFSVAYPYAFITPSNAQGQLLAPQVQPRTIATNRGKWYAQPVIRFYGLMISPTLTNQTNGQVIQINGSISNGDYIEIDMAAGTMVNSLGVDIFSALSPGSDNLQLEPGDNYLVCSCSTTGGAANCIVGWRHSWL